MFSLVSIWTIKEGQQQAAIAALKNLAQQVQEKEADTLMYLVHTPDMSQASLPTPSPLQVVFVEIYKDQAAFLAHVNGPVFKNFVAENVDLFLSTTSECTGGGSVTKPYTGVEFLIRQAGFIRPGI